MKKKASLLLLLILLFPVTYGMSADYDLSLLDVSSAIISIAGPRHLYIRSATYDSQPVSFVLESEDSTGQKWKVREIYSGKSPLIPDNIFLNFAEITPMDDGSIEISGIIVEGQSYTANMEILDAETLVATEYPEEGAPSGRWTSTMESLREQILAEAGASVEEAPETITPDMPESEQVAALQKQVQESGTRIRLLLEENEAQTLTITSLTEENREYEDTVNTLSRENLEYQEEVEALEKEKVILTEVNRQLKESFQEALERLRGAIPADTGAAPAAERSQVFNKTLITGFETAMPQMGSWRITESEVLQVDSSQYFAKLVLPIEQTTKPTLYSFQARSTGEGWVGLGLHFFATDRDGRRGYGYGDSLLFWLTRDPNYYGTRDTHAQLYRSDDAVNMEMVLDAIIEEPISDYLKVDIIYEPEAEYFTVFIGGEEKLKYKTWFDIESGIEIAFRTLRGGAGFKDLTVKTIE